MRTCKKVKKHEKENGGKIELEWLEEHTRDCKTCKEIMKVMRAFAGDILISAGGGN